MHRVCSGEFFTSFTTISSCLWNSQSGYSITAHLTGCWERLATIDPPKPCYWLHTMAFIPTIVLLRRKNLGLVNQIFFLMFFFFFFNAVSFILEIGIVHGRNGLLIHIPSLPRVVCNKTNWNKSELPRNINMQKWMYILILCIDFGSELLSFNCYEIRIFSETMQCVAAVIYDILYALSIFHKNQGIDHFYMYYNGLTTRLSHILIIPT